MNGYYNVCWYCDTEFRTDYPDQELCGNCVVAIGSDVAFSQKDNSKYVYEREKLLGYQTKRELEALKNKKPIPDLKYGSCRTFGVKPYHYIKSERRKRKGI